jgi:CO dehydrogenase maturation factor
MAGKKKVLAGKRIGVFGKGGCGKSTAVVLLAKALADSGYEVCVLDADSTNIGLHRALGLDESPVSLIEHFGGTVFSGGLVTCPVDDPTPLPGAEMTLNDLPSQYYARNRNGTLYLIAGKIGDKGPGAGCDGPISKIARDLTILGEDEEDHVTLVDFKAGFEDSARGVITSLDWAIVIVDPTIAAIQMAANMKDMVARLKGGELPSTRHLESLKLVEIANMLFREAKVKGILFVLNRIRDEETESYVRRKLKEKGIEPVGVIHEDPSISMSWLKGTPLEAIQAGEDIQGVVEKLEAAEEAYSAQGMR